MESHRPVGGSLSELRATTSSSAPATARSAISASTQYFLARSSTRVTR